MNELPKKLKAIIIDNEYVFLIRIGTEPRTTDTGIANIIPCGIDRPSRDYTIRLAKCFVKYWNCHNDLMAVLNDVRDWLDTSSLQQVIVHSGVAETDALIMGIASHLTRIEAALAKAGEK